MKLSVYIGFEPREAAAFAVARWSAIRRMSTSLPLNGLVLEDVQLRGLYRRPIEWRDGPAGRRIMWDPLSKAPMSTQHANARFLVPHLAKHGWALFMDGDVLVRGNLCRLFEGLDRSKALYCVKHPNMPPEGLKMDGQAQLQYARKNWSSVMIFNCDHEANAALTLGVINAVPGRDLHRFFWLTDDQIGELPREWNWLVRQSPAIEEPKIVHFTEGTPDMPGYEADPYTDEWRAWLTNWALSAR
jgi:lipopolysaccharide biosynthesis glycosyltransferase